ncbi:hypothetical protein K504DRAFT_223157 [Pleomassaria siparia CBS 279.74]|uniref:DUF6594 domain-containing protein n=1 Tax=Pleomassaria siparia CBS 279.74 TaxID=1314801 RepID=A0A6G1KFC1_9PLEO|nr:hypothetical protein K504DRAFT_223157 [Pleomassaria siparia CBS 279.74]
MPDCRASLEGTTLGRPRHRIPTSDDTPASLASLSTGSAAQSAHPVPRRRPLRPKPAQNELLQSTHHSWVDEDNNNNKGESRKPSRKALGGTLSPPPQSSTGEEPPHRQRDTLGIFSKLGRISEGKENRNTRHRKGSTASSIDDYTPAPRRRRRPVDDATLARRPIRQKHASLQRRVNSLSNFPNHSLISVLSGVTQHSGASSGSNSTITQQSYDKTHHNPKRRPLKEKRRLQERSATPKPKTMEPQQSNVFQYMSQDLPSEQFHNGVTHDGRPSSSSSSTCSESSHDTRHDDEQSSNAEELENESPMTSPASTRRPGSDDFSYRGRFDSASGVSVRESSSESARHTAENYQIEEEDEDDEDDEEQEEEEEEDSDESDEDEVHDHAYSADVHNDNPGRMQYLAMERVPPPRLPSTSSSRHSDPHTRRMRTQEQELRDYVLQSPQPQRDFQFVGGPSPKPPSTVPSYDAHSQPGARPAGHYVQAPYPPGWTPHAPPPQAIGYYSPPPVPPVPYAPTVENHTAMASQYPMTAPNGADLPPFHQALQPPHYQTQPIGPDLTKTTLLGYELLADKLTRSSRGENDAPGGDQVVPMYRKFEQLNHRVLLHLQDEISELEEELRHLDECIAQSSPRSETGHVHPASRRGDARYGGELHYKRTDLLGRVYLKLGQYNQALSSYSSMLKNLDAANAEDMHAYHSWMERHVPIDRTEARFLERKGDLLTVSQRRSATAVGGVRPQQSAAIGLPLILVLPLMAFAVVPGLLGRLFIVMLIGGAEVMLVTWTELLDLMTVKEWVACSSV